MSNKNTMIRCRNCNAEIAKHAKVCPTCGAKNKKPFYRKTWFIILAVLVVIGAISSIGGKKADQDTEEQLAGVEVDSTADEISQPTEMPEATETLQPTEAPQLTETEQPAESQESVDQVEGMRSDFKAAMDSYEEFMNQYCDFMKKYEESNGTDLSLAADYAKFVSKYQEVTSSFDTWNSQDMNATESAYYIEVQNRINTKLLEVAQ